MSYAIQWYPFAKHPKSDSCWSLSTGPDGRIYAAACCEGVPGGIVKVVRYNKPKDRLEYLFDLDRMVDDPRDSGRATQCKIHYSFAHAHLNGIQPKRPRWAGTSTSSRRPPRRQARCSGP